jgi:hypothetical protein
MLDFKLDDINVCEHAKLRYCERIVGISKFIDPVTLEKIDRIQDTRARFTEVNNEIKRYLIKNNDRIVDDIRNMFLYSELVYRGAFGGNGTTKDYYSRDDIILVSETSRPQIITLYRAEFGFGSRDRQLALDLKEDIATRRKEVDAVKAQVELEIPPLREANAKIDEDIKNLESQVELLRSIRKTNTDVIDSKQTKIILANKRLEQIAHQLCNNTDYRRDMTSA